MSDSDAAEITYDPAPPTQGGSMTIEYSGTLPVTLDIKWVPDGGPKTVEITSSSGTTITVPDDAESFIITDPTGNAPANGDIVDPS